jgi:hypothetical protein
MNISIEDRFFFILFFTLTLKLVLYFLKLLLLILILCWRSLISLFVRIITTIRIASFICRRSNNTLVRHTSITSLTLIVVCSLWDIRRLIWEFLWLIPFIKFFMPCWDSWSSKLRVCELKSAILCILIFYSWMTLLLITAILEMMRDF